MKALQIFSNPLFGEIRTAEEDGKILFCGGDVAKSLGYSNPRKALLDHCKGVTKRDTPTNGGNQELSFLPESDLYRLIVSSKLPAAEKFEQWVFEEVLPTIRRRGMYATDELLNNPDLLISLAQELKEERHLRNRLQDKLESNAPKVLFADAVAASRTSILIGELAKLIKQNSVAMGQTRLFEWLHCNGYLIRRQGTDYNMPTQKSMEQGLFEIKETSIVHSDGHTSISKTPKVTGKGQQYFINLFLKVA